MIITMDLQTTKYQQETPVWLWDSFKNGPAAGEDRLDHRITRLIAVDVLKDGADELTDEETEHARALAAGVEFYDGA